MGRDAQPGSNGTFATPRPGSVEQDLVLHAAAWTHVDDAEERGGGARPASTCSGRGTSSSSARPSSTSPPTTSSTGRSGSRTSSPPCRARLAAYGRTKLEGERELRDGLGRAQLLALRLDGPQLRPDDAPARRRARRGARRRRPGGLPDLRRPSRRRRRVCSSTLPFGTYHVAASRRVLRGPSSPRRSSTRLGSTAASFRSRPRSSAGRPRGPPTPSCAARSRTTPALPHWREGLRECLARLPIRGPDRWAEARLGERLRRSGGRLPSPDARSRHRAAAGSSAATSSSGSCAAGDEVVVLDKLTYAGQPDESRRRRRRGVAAGHRRRRRGRARRPRAARRSSTSPPRPTSTGRSSARQSSSRPTSSARTSCSSRCGAPDARSCTSRPTRSTATCEPGAHARRTDPLRPSSPYSVQGGGRPPGAGPRAHVRRRRRRSPAARTPTDRTSTRRS